MSKGETGQDKFWELWINYTRVGRLIWDRNKRSDCGDQERSGGLDFIPYGIGKPLKFWWGCKWLN